MRFVFRQYGDVVLTCLLALVFIFWPQIDMVLAAKFYEPGVGFPISQIPWVQVIYKAVAQFWVVAVAILLLLLLGFLPRFQSHLAPRRKMIAYLLVVLLIGPGLVVNTVLKDHWGRARPVHLVEFGGQAQFTPPLTPSNQCSRNCSFVSGHAAAAFFPMAGFWLTRRKRWLVAGIGLGLFIGYLRMAMGAHFLSDILFTGVIVHFTCRGFAHVFRLPRVTVQEKARLNPGFL